MSDVRDYVEGWACPGQAKVQHYFVNSLSLCHSWSFSGDVDETPEAYLKQCVRCARAVKGTIRAMPAAPVPTPQPACARCHGSGVVKLRSNGVLTGTAYCPVCCTADGRIKQSAPQPAPTVSMCPTCKRPQVDHGRAHDITDADALPLCFAAVGSAGARRECREFAGRAPTVSQGDAGKAECAHCIRSIDMGFPQAATLCTCCEGPLCPECAEDGSTTLRADLARVTAEVEQLRAQQAGVSVVAMGGTSEPQLVTRGMYGWSVAYDDVLALRLEFEAVEAERDALAVKLGEALKHIADDDIRAQFASIDDAGTAAKGTL